MEPEPRVQDARAVPRRDRVPKREIESREALMRPPFVLRSMSRTSGRSALRLQAVARHMMSTEAEQTVSKDPPVIFRTNVALRQYILNRPEKLNALDETMIGLLSTKIQVCAHVYILFVFPIICLKGVELLGFMSGHCGEWRRTRDVRWRRCRLWVF
jgi:hypothetical protein